MNPAERRGFLVTGQFPNRRNQIGLAPLDDSLLGAQAPPEVGMGQAGDQILGWIDLFVIIGNNPVNASQPDRFVKVTLGRLVAQVGSEETLVLDDSAMKIDHVQPSGPMEALTGRKRSSVLARNSRCFQIASG